MMSASAHVEKKNTSGQSETSSPRARRHPTSVASGNVFLTNLKQAAELQQNNHRNTFLSKVVDNLQTRYVSRQRSRKEDAYGKHETLRSSLQKESNRTENRNVPIMKHHIHEKGTDVDDHLPVCPGDIAPSQGVRRERFQRRRSVSAMSFLPSLLPNLEPCGEDSDEDLDMDLPSDPSQIYSARKRGDHGKVSRFSKDKDNVYWKGIREHYFRNAVSRPTSPRSGEVTSRPRNRRRLQYGRSYQVLMSSSGSKTPSQDEHKHQKVLRKIFSYNDFSDKRSSPFVLPLVKFQQAVRTVVLVLKATVSTRQNKQRSERRMLSWTQVHDDIGTSRRAYERFGLTFDPSEFKVKRETQINADVKMILSLDPEDRTPDQLRLALVGLNSAVEVFGEFPINMQRSLVRVGWYERFEAKRVIIRQGHTADNFYFILSGTAVVTVLETDPVTKEQYANTVALLKKGNSFGELALMHGARRSATVTCKDDVELLAVGRDDFVDIFMHVEKNREPDHIRFLHSIDVLQGWPINTLPYNNPKICLFTYFRRGVLLCKDSNCTDWIYVIKSGTCRVLKSLTVTRPRARIRKKTAKRKLPCRNNQLTPGILAVKETSSLSNAWTSSPDSGRNSSRKDLRVTFSLPRLHQTNQDELQQSAENHMKQLDDILRKRSLTQVGMFSPQTENNDSDVYTEQIFVEVQKMGPKDIYGLEQAVFSLIRCTMSTSLVSDGAECVLINRKFFLRHLSEDTAKSIRKMIQPFPTEEALRHKLENKASWEAYKTSTLIDQLVYRKHVHDYLNF